MPARGTNAKKSGAARSHLNDLGDELDLKLKELGQAPTAFVRNSKYPVGVSHETMARYCYKRDQEPYIPTLIRIAMAMERKGLKIDPFHFVKIVADSAYRQVAPEYQNDGTATLEVETPDTIGTPAMPMQVVRDYQDLPVVDREIAARELLKAISRDFPMFGSDRRAQIQCLVAEAVGRCNRKDFAEFVGVDDSVIKAIEDGVWSKVALNDIQVLALSRKVYDPSGRLGQTAFFNPLLGNDGSNSIGVDPLELKDGLN